MSALCARRAAALAGSVLCAATPWVSAPAAQASPAASQPGWSILKLLNMKNYADLLTLATPAKQDAWAFGQTGAGKAVAVHWNGSTWAGSSIPGAFIRPAFTSATGLGNVWTGGSQCGGGPPSPSVTKTYVARYNGSAWTTTTWKTSAFCSAALVTTGAKNGWLLGNKQALHFHRGRWTKVLLPSLAQTLAATAVSASDIWSVNQVADPLHLSQTKNYFMHYNGSAWRTVSLPAITLPKNGYLYPFDIAAAAANDIWATVTVESAAAHSYLLHWNGSKWKAIALPVTPYQLLKVTPDGNGGAWAIMFRTTDGLSKFAHYSNGTWTYYPIPTQGLPRFTGGSASFDLYAISLIPGTSVALATGDVFYTDTNNVNRRYSVIFRYQP